MKRSTAVPRPAHHALLLSETATEIDGPDAKTSTALVVRGAPPSGVGLVAPPRRRGVKPALASTETSVRLTFSAEVPSSALVVVAPPPALVGPRNAEHMGMSRRELLEVFREMRADPEFAAVVIVRSRKNPQATPDDVRAFLRARHAAGAGNVGGSGPAAVMPEGPPARRRREDAARTQPAPANDAAAPTPEDVLREVGYRRRDAAPRRTR